MLTPHYPQKLYSQHPPGLDHLLGRLAVPRQLFSRLAGEFWLNQLHWQVVHNLAVHGHGDLGKAERGQQTVGARVDHLSLHQPAAERARRSVNACNVRQGSDIRTRSV